MIGSKQKRPVEEYRKLDRLSSSDLRTFALDRRKFYKTVVLREKDEEEEYSKSLLIGDIVHTLLLQPENFDEKYFMSICPTPPTGLMLAFTEALYKQTLLAMDDGGNVTKEFTELAKEAHTNSGFKWTLDRVLKEFTDSNAELYYKELREAKTYGKTIVCVDDLSIAEKIVTQLKTHPFTSDIFTRETDGRYKVFNELQIDNFSIDELPLKAMLDKVIVDTREKVVFLYDLKVVWDNIRFYREYYLKRLAYIQAYIYYTALQHADLGIDISEYTIKYPIFVAADSGNFYSPVKYLLNGTDITNAYGGFEVSGRQYTGVDDIIDNIKFCQENQNWTVSKEVFLSEGFSLLK